MASKGQTHTPEHLQAFLSVVTSLVDQRMACIQAPGVIDGPGAAATAQFLDVTP